MLAVTIVLPVSSLAAGDLQQAGDDFTELFSFPSRWDGAEWRTAGGVLLGAGVSCIWFDEPVDRFMKVNRTPFFDDLAGVGNRYGALSTGYIIGSAIYLAGAAAGDKEVRTTGRAVLEAHTFSLLITGVLKVVLGRSRPFLGEGNRQFEWFETENSRWSAPSGHATSAFALSSVLSQRIDHPLADAGLYSLASITLFDRLYEHRHWLSDTIAGAAIGTAVGLAVAGMVDDDPVPAISITVPF